MRARADRRHDRRLRRALHDPAAPARARGRGAAARPGLGELPADGARARRHAPSSFRSIPPSGFEPDARGARGARDAALQGHRPELARQPHRRRVRTRDVSPPSSSWPAAHDLWVISDECYDELVFEGEHVEHRRPSAEPERVVTVFTFSKSYAMTGWRVGYVVAPSELAGAIAKAQEPVVGNASSVSQKAAEAALIGPQECVGEMRDAYRERRDAAIASSSRTPASTSSGRAAPSTSWWMSVGRRLAAVRPAPARGARRHGRPRQRLRAVEARLGPRLAVHRPGRAGRRRRRGRPCSRARGRGRPTSLRQRRRPRQVEQDLAELAAPLEALERRGGLLEREDRVDRRGGSARRRAPGRRRVRRPRRPSAFSATERGRRTVPRIEARFCMSASSGTRPRFPAPTPTTTMRPGGPARRGCPGSAAHRRARGSTSTPSPEVFSAHLVDRSARPRPARRQTDATESAAASDRTTARTRAPSSTPI